MMDREQQIRERAYAIWQREGGVDGLQEDHWHRAESELSAEEEGSLLDATLQPDAPQAGTEDQNVPLASKRKAAKKYPSVKTSGDPEGKVHMGHIPGDPVVK